MSANFSDDDDDADYWFNAGATSKTPESASGQRKPEMTDDGTATSTGDYSQLSDYLTSEGDLGTLEKITRKRLGFEPGQSSSRKTDRLCLDDALARSTAESKIDAFNVSTVIEQFLKVSPGRIIKKKKDIIDWYWKEDMVTECWEDEEDIVASDNKNNKASNSQQEKNLHIKPDDKRRVIEALTDKLAKLNYYDQKREISETFLVLYRLCDDERSVGRFVQCQGVPHLHKFMDHHVTFGYCAKFYGWNSEKSAADITDYAISSAILFLCRISYFQCARVAVETAGTAHLLAKLFDPMNSYFSEVIANTFEADKKPQEFRIRALKQIRSDKIFAFARRSLTCSMIGCPLKAYAYDFNDFSATRENLQPQADYSAETEKSGDRSELADAKLPYSFDFLQPLFEENSSGECGYPKDSAKMEDSAKAENLFEIVPNVAPVAEDDYCPFEIVHQIDSCTFWAVRKDSQAKIVQEVIDCFSSADSTACKMIELHHVKKQPRLFDLVLAPGNTVPDGFKRGSLADMDIPFYRFFIIDIAPSTEWKHLTIGFAVDFGFFAKIPWKFLRNINTAARKISAATFLCVAEDIVPMPNPIVYSWLSIAVRNLCSYSFIAESFAQNEHFFVALSNDVRLIYKLGGSFDDIYYKMAINAAALLLRLSTHSRLKVELSKRKFVELLLSVISKIVENSRCDNKQQCESLLLSIVQCLSNIVYANIDARTEFQKCNGEVIATCFMQMYPEDHDLHKSALDLMKNVLTDKVSTDYWTKTMKNLSGDQLAPSPNDLVSQLLAETIQFKTAETVEACVTKDTLIEYINIERDDAPEELTPRINDFSTLNVLRNIRLPPVEGRFYVKNSRFAPVQISPYDEPIWEVLCEEMDLENLKTFFVQEYVCAALNSGYRLILYFGVSPDDRRVKGIQVRLNERDCLRVGSDFALSRAFRPVLQPNMYGIEFVPVFHSNNKKMIDSDDPGEKMIDDDDLSSAETIDDPCDSLELLDDCYVVEIHIYKTSKEMYQLEDSGKIFVKLDDEEKPRSCTMMDALLLTAYYCEKEQEQKIESLKRSIGVMERLLN